MYSCNGYGPYLDACPPIIYQSYEWIVNNAMGWDHIKQWYERERERETSSWGNWNRRVDYGPIKL